jgi:hypothetical protein
MAKNIDNAARHGLGTIAMRVMIVVASMLLSRCNEPYPSRKDPTEVFKASLTGNYVLTASENAVKFHFTIVNDYDETFQARAALRGTVQIILTRNPSFRKTASLGPSNLTLARNYDSGTGVLTIDPGDSIRLSYTWDFRDDNGDDLRSILSYGSDPECPSRRLAYEEVFLLQGELTVYDRLPAVQAPMQDFSLCYVTNWVRAGDCPPILTNVPCRYRR